MSKFSSKTTLAGVIGDPISHSLSPKLHGYLLKKYNIDGAYNPFLVTKENLIPTLYSFIESGFKGCNVTIPHKEDVLKICDHLSKSALAIGAVNTIIITENKKLYGHNSDGTGFINNIKQNQPDFNFQNKKIVVLGAGGAARAVCFSLLEEKVSDIIIANRNMIRSQKLVNDFKIKNIEWEKRSEILVNCDLLVNTTSLGMEGQEELEIDLRNLKESALVCDIVYKPLMTKLLISAQELGNPIVTGIGMLIHQALIGFEAWYGIKPQADQELLDYLIKEL